MVKTISWACFFVAALLFVLTNVTHPLLGILLVAISAIIGAVAVILDCFGKFNLSEQSIKWFVYALIGIKVGQLYEMPTLICIATVFAVLLILVFIVRGAKSYDNMLDEARKIDAF